MSLNVTLLRDSFGMVVEREPEIMHRFYEHLFARHPEVRSMFGRNSQSQQEKMLAQALAAVLDHLEDAAWLSKTLGEMGSKHVGYGVKDEMYGWVGDALLVTLAEVAGKEWSAELHVAWADAFNAIAGLMLKGAEESRRNAQLASARQAIRHVA
jgi:hemoglobin-like flavoprotein